eukprot:1557540-Rhodomonas_salina.4
MTVRLCCSGIVARPLSRSGVRARACVSLETKSDHRVRAKAWQRATRTRGLSRTLAARTSVGREVRFAAVSAHLVPRLET